MDDEIDALYDLPPGEFVAARDALVKQLRAEKRRDEADEIKRLRRPSVAAWAVNQLARRHPDDLEEVLAAGAQLASAQRRLLSGIKDAGMSEAAARRRAAIDQAWRTVVALLAEQGAGAAAQRQAVVATLEAASVDEDAAAEVREGRLTTELDPPSDFGVVSGFAVVADEPETATDDGDGGEAAQRRQAEDAAITARQRADEAQREAGDARQAAVRARAEAERLQQRAEEAAQHATDAARDAQQRAQEADEAEAAAIAAREEADRLTADLQSRS